MLVASAFCEGATADCRLEGSLRDELGTPLVAETIRVIYGGPPAVTDTIVLRRCSEQENARARDEGAVSSVMTNERGEFCASFETEATGAPLRFTLSYDGNGHNDPSTLQVEVASTEKTELEWINQRRRVEADETSAAFDIRLQLGRHPVAHQTLTLEIATGRDSNAATKPVQATATTGETGVAHFSIGDDALKGTPAGAGSLEVRFAGSPQLPPARRMWPLLRVCKVILHPEPPPGEIARGDRTSVAVEATSNCHAPASGILEFASAGVRLCQVHFLKNRARCEIDTAQFPQGPLAITASYLPPSEAWDPATDLHFSVVIAPPRRTAAVLLLLATATIVAWLLAKWRAVALIRLPVAQPKSGMHAASSIDREPLEPGKSGWYGVIVDAHTGAGIPGAHLHVEVPEFSQGSVAYDAVSDSNGEFAFPPFERRDLSRIVATAAHYSGGRWPLPSPGRLTIRLQTYRRAVLQAFISWFRIRAGAAAVEPTPAQVTSDAARAYAPDIIEWVKNVERTAFGPEEHDHLSESLVSGPPPRHNTSKNE